jgi:hypothetical protein
MQGRARGQVAIATVDHSLEIADAFLVIASVVVLATGNTHANRTGYERLAHPNAPLGTLEIRQDIDITPATMRRRAQLSTSPRGPRL